MPLKILVPILIILFLFQALNHPAQAHRLDGSIQGCPPWPIAVNSEANISNAINCFNAETTPATYVLSVTTNISLTSSLPPITNANPGVRLDIRGIGHIIDGQDILGVRPFAIAPATTVSMQGIRIIGGLVITNGGGIFNQGTLSLTNSVVRNNAAEYGGGILFDGSVPGAVTTVSHSSILYNESYGDYGAGIYASDDGDTDGKILIEYTTVYSNVNYSDEGSGIANYGPVMTITHSAIISNVNYNDGDAGVGAWAPTTILNTTISGNRAMANGVGAGGLGVYEAVVTLVNVTIVNNWMAPGVNGSGGVSDWDHNGGELLIVNNSIIANNTGGANPDCTFGQGGNDGLVDFNNAPNILEEPTGCNNINNGSVQNVDPLIALLANNGGETRTHALLPGSPAINQITTGTNGCGTTVTTDQRGVPRPQGPGCDIGAFEVGHLLYLPAVLKGD